MKNANLLLFLCLFSIRLNAQRISGDHLSGKLDSLISGSYPSITPGCTFLVAEKGKVIYEKGFGLASLELNVPMRPEMVFRIGSVTKQFTAIAILQLVEQGKISLQDSIRQFIKNFPYKGNTITIENLLTHTSGLIGYEVLDSHIPNAIRIDFPHKMFIDSVAVLPLEFVPGTKYNYSNTNYYILGYIIEQVTGKKYNDYLRENIFRAAGMLATYYDSPVQIIKNRVSGYTGDSAHYRNAGYISMNHVYSAGALLSNVSDLYKWHRALYEGKLVKKETLQKAFTPYKLSNGSLSGYGYGWFIQEFQGSPSIGHVGAIDGFKALEMYFPGEDVFIAALANSESDGLFTLTDKISRLVLKKPVYKDVKVPDTVLQQYTGIYKFYEDTTQHVRVRKEGSRLYADLSNKSGMNMVLVPQSQTLFYLPEIRRMVTSIEFIVENGRVKGLYWIQGKKHEAGKKE